MTVTVTKLWFLQKKKKSSSVTRKSINRRIHFAINSAVPCDWRTKMLRKSASLRGVNIVQNSIRVFSTPSLIDVNRTTRVLLSPRHAITRYQLSAPDRRFSSSEEVWTLLCIYMIRLDLDLFVCFSRKIICEKKKSIWFQNENNLFKQSSKKLAFYDTFGDAAR